LFLPDQDGEKALVATGRKSVVLPTREAYGEEEYILNERVSRGVIPRKGFWDPQIKGKGVD